MARKKVPSNQGATWTSKDLASIRRLVKAGATGKTIAEEVGRSIFALYQKASMEGISLSKTRAFRRSSEKRKRS